MNRGLNCLLALFAFLGLADQQSIAADGGPAQAAMDKAHHGRATWTKFPGFTADVTAASAGRASSGTFSVTALGAFGVHVSGAAIVGLAISLAVASSLVVWALWLRLRESLGRDEPRAAP